MNLLLCPREQWRASQLGLPCLASLRALVMARILRNIYSVLGFCMRVSSIFHRVSPVSAPFFIFVLACCETFSRIPRFWLVHTTPSWSHPEHPAIFSFFVFIPWCVSQRCRPSLKVRSSLVAEFTPRYSETASSQVRAFVIPLAPTKFHIINFPAPSVEQWLRHLRHWEQTHFYLIAKNSFSILFLYFFEFFWYYKMSLFVLWKFVLLMFLYCDCYK